MTRVRPHPPIVATVPSQRQPTGRVRRAAWAAALLTAVAVLGGCAAPNASRAPVEERTGATTARPTGARPGRTAAAPALPASAASAPAGTAAQAPSDPAAKPPPPGIENAGKPGYQTVRPGDTLIRIALDNGQNWRDIARWNALENPNLIEVGQVLRVVPPSVDAAAVSSRGVAVPRVESRPLEPGRLPTAAGLPASAASGVAAAPGAAASAAPAPAAPPAPASAVREADEDLPWQWPAAGAVVGSFEEGRTRGVLIAGKAGDPVLAAADGRVIYAGSALRGYGNLVIVKHNASFLTAYAHNQTLLVKEDQPVRRGQKIAEMGATDAERVQLHFEIRRQGKPVDPLRLLPAR